jgi:hypothetical protein
MPVNLVQSAANAFCYNVNTPGSTPISQAFSSNNTAGNMILAIVCSNSGNISWADLATFTDSRGNTYTNIVSFNHRPNSGPAIYVYYAPNIAGGANAVTATFGTGWTGFGSLNIDVAEYLIIAEFSGFGTSLSQGNSFFHNDSAANGTPSVTDSLGNTLTLTFTGANQYNAGLLVNFSDGSVDYPIFCANATSAHGTTTEDTLSFTPTFYGAASLVQTTGIITAAPEGSPGRYTNLWLLGAAPSLVPVPIMQFILP